MLCRDEHVLSRTGGFPKQRTSWGGGDGEGTHGGCSRRLEPFIIMKKLTCWPTTLFAGLCSVRALIR